MITSEDPRLENIKKSNNNKNYFVFGNAAFMMSHAYVCGSVVKMQLSTFISSAEKRQKQFVFTQRFVL